MAEYGIGWLVAGDCYGMTPDSSEDEDSPEYTYGVIKVEADHILEAFRKELLTDDSGEPLNEDEDPKSRSCLPGRGILYLPEDGGQCIYEGPFFGSDTEPIVVGVVSEEAGQGEVYVGNYNDAVQWVLNDGAGIGIGQITL